MGFVTTLLYLYQLVKYVCKYLNIAHFIPDFVINIHVKTCLNVL